MVLSNCLRFKCKVFRILAVALALLFANSSLSSAPQDPKPAALDGVEQMEAGACLPVSRFCSGYLRACKIWYVHVHC